MGEINVASKLSFGEIAKRSEVGEIFEAIAEKNPPLSRIPAVACNQQYSHKIGRRTSVPSGTWTKAYKGVASKSSTTQVVTFNCALLEALSEIDARLVDTAQDPAKTRREEDMAFVPGLSEQVWESVITGTTTSAPEQFDGLQQYLNSLAQTMVFDGGNAGGTSIYVADFSPDKCYFIYPSGVRDRGQFGLKVDTNPDGGNGKVWTTEDADATKKYLVYRTLFQWWLGFVVRDELSIGRYANINPTVGGSNTFDENKLIEMLTYGNFGRGTTLLCTKEIQAQMRIRLKDKSNVNFDVARGLWGEEVLGFRGNGYFAPIYRCDAISTSEATVS
jgi:hypothetical protein